MKSHKFYCISESTRKLFGENTVLKLHSTSSLQNIRNVTVLIIFYIRYYAYFATRLKFQTWAAISLSSKVLYFISSGKLKSKH